MNFTGSNNLNFYPNSSLKILWTFPLSGPICPKNGSAL